MKLLYKEFALAAHPSLFIFTFLGCLVIVPAYPYSVIFMFGCLAPFITFMFARENNDAWFTAILPVKKRETVKAKCMLIIAVQLGQLIISVPFAVLRNILSIPNNPVGMDATVGWYGFGFIIFSVFDLVFFPTYYKSGYKAGKAFLLAMIPVALLMACTEGIIYVPHHSWLDSSDPESLLRQLPVLGAGILIYVVSVFSAYHIAVKRYENVNL